MSVKDEVLEKLGQSVTEKLKSLEKDYAAKYKAISILFRKDHTSAFETQEWADYQEVSRLFTEFEEAYPTVAALRLPHKIEAEVKAELGQVIFNKYTAQQKKLSGINHSVAKLREIQQSVNKSKFELSQCNAEILGKLNELLGDEKKLEAEHGKFQGEHGFLLMGHNQKAIDKTLGVISETKKKEEKLTTKAKNDMDKANQLVSEAPSRARRSRQSAHANLFDAYESYDDGDDGYAAYAYDDAMISDLGGHYYQSMLSDSADAGSMRTVTADGAITAEYAVAFTEMMLLISVISIVFLLCGCLCGMVIGRKYQQAKKRQIVEVNDNELFE